MAHFAQIDANNVVITVDVVSNAVINDLPFPQSEPLGVAFLQSIYGLDTTWKQTSYNGNFRKRYAGVGYSYSDQYDAFISPKPYPSWVFNIDNLDWNAPIPYPTDGKVYEWDEVTLSWVLIAPQPQR